MARKKVTEVYEDNEEYEDEQLEEVAQEKEAPRISKKTGKPLLSDEEKRAIRVQNMQKAIEAKKKKNEITKTLKEKKKELTQIELEKQKKELEEIQRQIELKKQQDAKQARAKPVKKIVKQIIEEDDDESEPEEQIIVRRKKKPASVPVVHEDDYSQLVKQSAVEQLQKRLENERIRMSLLSIAPNYRF